MQVVALGALCTVSATGGWGWILARGLRQRPDELAAAQAALSILRTEIAYGRTPLAEALTHAGRGVSPAVGRLFAGAAERLATGGGWSPAEAWEGALAEADGLSAWTREDVAELARLGGALGRSGVADQVRHIAACAERLRLAEQRARHGLERRARMWLYLGVLAGAGLALATAR